MKTGVGKRLTEERKQLKLSQAAFAEFVGVSFSSQRRYENESSSPDTSYLEALRARDIDVDYILTGRLGGFSDKETFNVIAAFSLLIKKIALRIGSDSDAIEIAANYPVDSPSVRKGVFELDPLVDELFLGTSLAVNANTLAWLIQGVEKTIQDGPTSVTLEKKTQVIARLYSQFGHDPTLCLYLDQTAISEALGFTS